MAQQTSGRSRVTKAACVSAARRRKGLGRQLRMSASFLAVSRRLAKDAVLRPAVCRSAEASQKLRDVRAEREYVYMFTYIIYM